MNFLVLLSILVTLDASAAVFRPQDGTTTGLDRSAVPVGNDELAHTAQADPSSHPDTENLSITDDITANRDGLPGQNMEEGLGWRNHESEYHSHNNAPGNENLHLYDDSGNRPEVFTKESHRMDFQSDYPTDKDIPIESINYVPKLEGHHLTAQDRKELENWKRDIAQLKIFHENKSNLERFLRISTEQNDYTGTNLNDQEKNDQIVQDHKFIMNTQKKVELLMKKRLSELLNVNPDSHDHPQDNIIPNAKCLKLDMSTNLEYMKSYPAIQQGGSNQVLEELMKDIMHTIPKIESRDSLMTFETPLHTNYFAIHPYLATVINFLNSNQIITNEITRKIFEDDKFLSWIIKLNTRQLADQFPFLLNEGFTDITNQWFWSFEWKFLTVLNEKDSSRINFRFLMMIAEADSKWLKDEYDQELDLISRTIISRKYTNTLRNEYGSQNSETLKEEDLEMLKDDVKKLRAFFSKTLNKHIDERPISTNELRQAEFICEILDFIQVHFHNQFINEEISENLVELELHSKLILNLYRARYLESMAKYFLQFSKDSSNLKKISEMNVPEIYQYYKGRVQHTRNEFKEMYKIVSNRNDNVSMCLKNKLLLTDMMKHIDDSVFSADWDELKEILKLHFKHLE